MKLAKLSLAAAMLIGASAYAEVTTSGNAQLFYGTVDAGTADLFDKSGAYGNASASVDVEYKAEKATVNVGMTYVTTMGLENTLVSGIWTGGTLKDQIWIDEAKLTFTPIEKTALVLGRQYLDTPLAFSETWNIASNSMDAAVVVDSHVPKTTLIGAWVGRGNGASGFMVVDNTADLNLGGNYNTYGSAVLNAAGLNGTLSGKGAYAFGAVTTAIPMTTVQAWYYDVESIATAYWVQADFAMDMGLSLGAQYANVNPSDLVDAAAGASLEDTKGFAVKAGFDVKDLGLSLSAAYSSVDKANSPVQIANTATGAMGGAQSKLYTEAWWNFGYVGAADTDALTFIAEYGIENVVDLGLYVTSTTNDTTNVDMLETTLTASKSFGALDASVAYVYTDADDQNLDANNNADAFNNLQVYLTYNF